MSKLALLGGEPLNAVKIEEGGEIWPPINNSTADKIKELYLSREWTAFHSTEGIFTKAFAEHHGTKYGVFMANGTVTMQCALGALGIGSGDEVIVPALTWYATAMAAHYVGATPVFVDVESDTLCIDPEKIVAAITEKTKAIIPVHLYGSMADMDKIMSIARQYNLRVIEDCAHMHGGMWDGRGIGSIGDVGSFSFQHSKTMASAEGGICITDDANLYERIYRMKHIGYGPGQSQGQAADGPEEGLLCYPFRATAFQALILNEQLPDLTKLLQEYNSSVEYLEERLGKSTKIRFQKGGRKASLQGYYGWAMMFDDPDYADIPLKVIQKAIMAEGLPIYPTWGPVYDFILFNLGKASYRLDSAGYPVTDSISKHMLFVFHAHLGLGRERVKQIADILEKVVINTDELREYSASINEKC